MIAGIAARDLHAQQLGAGGRDVEWRGGEGVAAVGRFVHGRRARAPVCRRADDREHVRGRGRIGKVVGRDRGGQRTARAVPAARIVVGDGQPDLERPAVQPIGGRRAHRVQRRHRRLGALARPLPGRSAVVRDDEPEVRRQHDLLRPIDGHHHRVRIWKRAVGRGPSGGCEQREPGQESDDAHAHALL